MKVKGQLCLQTHIELMSASQCLGAFVSVAEAQGWNKTLCMPKKHMKIIFFNWYSLHARLSSHYEAWSYKKRKHKKVKAYRKSI